MSKGRKRAMGGSAGGMGQSTLASLKTISCRGKASTSGATGGSILGNGATIRCMARGSIFGPMEGKAFRFHSISKKKKR